MSRYYKQRKTSLEFKVVVYGGFILAVGGMLAVRFNVDVLSLLNTLITK